MREGIRLTFKQKFFNQWREIKLSEAAEGSETVDQYQVSQSLDKAILEAIDLAFKEYMRI